MANWNDTDQRQGFGSVPRAGDAVARQETFDAGLRAHMLKIYNYMASGVLLTGIVALVTSELAGGSIRTLTPLGEAIYFSPLRWVVMLSPLVMILVVSFGINKLSQFAMQACFWIFASLMGISLSSIFLVYTDASIAQMFFIAAAAFGSLSLWGYTTKKDLSGWGSFLIMGLVGIIIASVVNLFILSSMMGFVISVLSLIHI